MDRGIHKYRQLDPQQIIATIKQLRDRVEARFPESGLGKVVAEILIVARQTVSRMAWIQRPHMLLRCASILLSCVIVALLVGLLLNIREFRLSDFSESIQGIDSSISSVVFVGAAILFFVSWENRIKRSRALKALHELRALAHIVDMHQLTKDPESYFGGGPRANSPERRPMTPFELNRYLDYCSEALALLSKIAALHVQEFQDEIVLDAVDDVEDLTTGLSRKIWQKIMILESLDPSNVVPQATAPTTSPTGTIVQAPTNRPT